MARRPAGLGSRTPGTLALAALAPGIAEIGRVDPPRPAPGGLTGATADPRTTARPLAAPLTGAMPDDPPPAPLTGAAPAPLTGAWEDPSGPSAHSAPGAGGGGGAYP